MRFHAPLALLLAIPWLIAWALFARTQRRALGWVLTNVSERFRSRFSVHSARSLGWHLRLLAAMGLLLILGAAGPYLPGTAEIEAEHARVLLLFDASASMYATDVEIPPGEGGEDGPTWNRFAAGKALAQELVLSLPDTSFAIASFSGSVAIHSPMSADKRFLLEALRSLEIHGQYQNTGSSLAAAVDSIFDFQDATRPNLQAVILGDGEQPEGASLRPGEALGEALEALAAQGVAIHTVAIGSVEGQGRRILDFRDIRASKDEPAVLQSYHTRRVDTELRRISKVTGGAFEVLASGSLDRVRTAIRSHDSPPARIERSGSGTDLAVFCLLGFLISFLADGLLIGRRPRHEPLRFDIGRIGRPRADTPSPGRIAGVLLVGLALLSSTSCSNSPRARALRENEKGIALDALGRREEARVHYKRSLGYGVDAQIPAFNLARSIHKEGDYSQAHDLYQEALQIDPRLPEAYYNDGIALFDWGEAERDPKGCQLERTRELWQRALERFAKAEGLTNAGGSTGRRARENRRHLDEELDEVDRLIADPPPECLGGGGGEDQDESPDQSQDQSQDQGDGGGSEGEGDNQSQGGGDPDGEGEDQGQGGGDSEADDQGQGGGESDGEGEDQGQGGGGGGGDDQGQGQGQGDSGTGGDGGDDQTQGGGSGTGDEGDDEDRGGGAGGWGDEDAEPDSEPDQDQDQGGGGSGSGDDPRGGRGGGGSPGQGPESPSGGSGGPPLTPDELEQIRQELARIGMQALESGKYHRRTLPEQFGKEHWSNPDRVIWW